MKMIDNYIIKTMKVWKYKFLYLYFIYYSEPILKIKNVDNISLIKK